MSEPVVLRQINRYAVKGLSGTSLPAVDLSAGVGIPEDRRYALALPTTQFDPAAPTSLPKTHFAMLMRHERLAELHCEYDPETTVLSVYHADERLAQGALSGASGRRAIESAVAPFVDQDAVPDLRLVEAPGHRFTDISVDSADAMEAVSLINLASVRDLEHHLGSACRPRTFQGQSADRWSASLGGVQLDRPAYEHWRRRVRLA